MSKRIFLHLSDFVDHSEKVEVPFALSQMGIANAVSIARSNVPRAISGMKETGHLIERQVHVTKVYPEKERRISLRMTVQKWLTIYGIKSQRLQFSCSPRWPIRELFLAEALERVELPLRHVDMLRYMDDSATIDLSGLTSGSSRETFPNTSRSNLSLT